MASKFTHILSLAKVVGWPTASSTLLRRAVGSPTPQTILLEGQAVALRPCDSDLFVAGQIFGREEYRLGRYQRGLSDLASRWASEGFQPVILDIGANVGYSAIYFAERFPQCLVIAVEADASTFRMLEENVAGHPRIRTVEAAVWNHEHGVRFSEPDSLGSWAGRVESGDGLTRSMHLATTFRDIPNARPLIIKLDVEGAEREIAVQATELFRDAPCILIEPHDFMLPGAGVLSPLFTALSGRTMDTILRDEVIMFFDSSLAPQAA